MQMGLVRDTDEALLTFLRDNHGKFSESQGAQPGRSAGGQVTGRVTLQALMFHEALLHTATRFPTKESRVP